MKATLITKQEITIEFWRDDSDPIDESHLEALKETGFDEAKKMIAEGFTSGELSDNIHMADDDNDGIGYTGWWNLEAGSKEI